MRIDISNKYLNILFNVTFIVLLVVLLYVFFNTILKWFLPFVLAFIVSRITNPIVDFLEKKVHIPRKLSSLITIFLSLLCIGYLIFIAIYRIVFEVRELSDKLPIIFNSISEIFSEIFFKGIDIYLHLPVELVEIVDSLGKAIANSFTSLITGLTEYTTKFAYNFATSLPSTFLFIVVLFVSTYFMSSDKDKISRFVKNKIPSQWIHKIITIKNSLLLALFGYIKAQFILMLITFVEITVGLLIIGVDYALLLALLTSIIDALPIVGSGIVFLPWIIFSLIGKKYTLAVSLLTLYLIIILVRQLLEPKIVSSQLGLYPLVTLMSVYVGLQIFGIMGILLGPMLVLLIKSIYSSGIFKIWKD